MIYKLCIQERYYRLGLCRIEYFSDLKELEQRRAAVTYDGVKVWVA